MLILQSDQLKNVYNIGLIVPFEENIDGAHQQCVFYRYMYKLFVAH